MVSKQAALTLKGKSMPCRINIPIWKALKEQGLSRSAYLIIRNCTLVTDDEIINASDSIELIPVVSGG